MTQLESASDENTSSTSEEAIAEREQTIQQLKEERNFIDAVLDTVGALITVVDANGQIVWFNKKCEEVTGYSSEEVEGESVFDLLVPPEDEEGVRHVIERHRRGEKQAVHENHWMTKKDERRLIHWSSTVLRNEDGQIRHVIGTGIDITERRQLERKVVAASDEERRRIGEDLHDMLASHLVGTAMMAEGLARKVKREESITEDDLLKVAKLVREASDQVRTMSHSLMPLEVQVSDLTDGLQILAWRYEDIDNGVECSFEADALAPRVSGDVASHLYRIASEAVNNALKHADPTSIVIRLGIDDGHLVLSVRDDGTGMPDGSDPTHGLGLHMMRYRAGLIEADLDVVPAEDSGTLVRCRLPLDALSSSDGGIRNSE